MNNDYVIVVEYKIKITSNVTYRKRFYYKDCSKILVSFEQMVLTYSFRRCGFYPVNISIYNNDNRLISSEDYSYEGR